MKDFLYEETAECANAKSERIKYNIAIIVIYLCIALFVVGVFLVVNYFDLSVFSKDVITIIVNVVLNLLPLVFIVGIAVFFYKIKNKYCVDYDYSFVSGSIRFSKVVNNRKRYFITEFDTSKIIKIGKVGSESFSQYDSDKNIEKFKLTSNNEPSEGKRFFYIFVDYNGDKELYIIECTETFIINIIKFSNKNLIEKDYK